MTIPTIKLAGKDVGRVGFGLMQLTWTPTPVPDSTAFAAMKAAVDAGATAWSTATFYGNGPSGALDNLALIGRFFKAYPEYSDKVVLVVKGGVREDLSPTNDLEYNRELLHKTQALLGAHAIDVYSPARLAPGVDPVAYLAPFEALRKESLFAHLGVSEVRAGTLTTLSAAYAIAVVEIEVSLWSWEQDIQDVIAWCNATTTPVFAYSPLGRGFLTRTYKRPEDVPAGSFQSMCPRFQGAAFYDNLKLVDALDAIAARRGLTTAQLAVAWVCGRGAEVMPIPGSSNVQRVTLNTEAGRIVLTKEDEAEIDAILKGFDLSGDRYPAFASDALMQ